MIRLNLPFIKLPTEFITLLKSNVVVNTSPAPVFDIVGKNSSLMMLLTKAFKEFDDSRGLEKILLALGWSSFRERIASVYIYKALNGSYPEQTYMDLVEDIKKFETKFSDHGVTSISRLFLLGFYLKLASIELGKKKINSLGEVKVSDDVIQFLNVSEGRSERIDWLILILMHLNASLGEKMLLNSLNAGKKFEELYNLMPKDSQEVMCHNLLAYGASIQEEDVFLYGKI